MTLARRIIPCLDTDGTRVVQKVNLLNLRDSGDPAELAGRYAEEGADELVMLDIATSGDNRPTFLETIRRVAAQLQIPLTAGGGIRTEDEARGILRAGADKVIINTAAVRNADLITQFSREFGEQAVILAIDAKRVGAHWQVFVRGGQEATGLNVLDWARQGEDLGAGEILLTSMDRDGTREGYDCELTAAVSSAVNVSIIASGGASTPDDFLAAFSEGQAGAALAVSAFQEATLSIRTLKQYLDSRGVVVRL